MADVAWKYGHKWPKLKELGENCEFVFIIFAFSGYWFKI